ncbi:MAG: hypothetical protein IJL55_08740 [Lachnospiraceae bacterium]|nr:hypothetical protein [Lachnospiraceae bacterium]
MKKLVILLIIGLVFGLINTNVSAAEKKSYKTEIESMLKKMADFEFSLLYEIDITEPKVGTTKSIKLDKDRMSRAAAFTLNYSSDDMVFKYDNGPDVVYKYRVNASALKKAGKNLFGKTTKVSYITSDERSRFEDVYKDTEYGAVYKRASAYHAEKGDYYVYSTEVKKKGKKYTATKKCYIGYYGGELTGDSNYTITYTLKKSSKSEYGYIIAGIKVKKTAKTFTAEDMYYLMTTDEDGDMLPTAYELDLGTDPLKADTDDDGMDDYLEYVNGRDPLDPGDKDIFDSDNDTDWDGLNDVDEINLYKTDPFNPDTDGDGLDDGLEVKNGFDPLKTDTDDDGVPDGKKEFEQTYVFDTASLGWRYEELLKSAGQKMTIMGSEMIIPEGIGFLKRVLIKASVAGDIYDIFEVKNMFGEHVMLTGVPYIGGIPVEISIDKDYLKNGFKSAKVIFEFDDSCFPEDKEIEIGPARCDDDLYFPQLIEDCELDEDNKTISFNIDKPGYYFIILIE